MIEVNKIIQGDALTVLKTMPDKCVNMCVTSPPYWGLRDYGTAKWEGGDPGCDHRPEVESRIKRDRKGLTGGLEYMQSQEPVYKDTCKKCGAIRVDNQLGLEKTPEEYVAKMVEIFREVRRVLRDDGTCWLNLGDSYNGSGRAGGDYAKGGLKEGQPKYPGRKINNLKPKDLVGIPWRVAFALQVDGWYLRQDIIWHKPNPMPESVTDRCTKAHEYIFLLSKSARYYYDNEAINEPAESPENKLKSYHNPENKKYSAVPDERWKDQFNGRTWGDTGSRNRRSVWTVSTKPYKGAHFATFPPDLIRPCILAGCPEGGIVLDPFVGSGTTAEVALKSGRNFYVIELNPEYIKLSEKRIGHILEQGRLF